MYLPGGKDVKRGVPADRCEGAAAPAGETGESVPARQTESGLEPIISFECVAIILEITFANFQTGESGS